jgi:hypothetical protein
MTTAVLIRPNFRTELETGTIVPLPYREARAVWLDFRILNGWLADAPYLSSPDSNYKLGLSTVPTYGLSLAPHRESGWNVCPNSTPECRSGCVSYAGHGGRNSVQDVRRMRTRFLKEHPAAAIGVIIGEINRAARKHGQIAVRLNTFSDIAWELAAPSLFDIPNVHYYDYTKRWDRTSTDAYWLTYSRSELTADADIVEACANGGNVAVIFGGIALPWQGRPAAPLPMSWLGIPVIDGDTTDARYADRRGVIVGLRAKGRLYKDEGNPFVVRNF